MVPVIHAPTGMATTTIRSGARFAVAAGIVGLVANVLLIAFYALQAGRPEAGTSLGTANDLVGMVGSLLMIPVAFTLSGGLPPRRAARVVQVAGVLAMASLAVLAPLLVFGVVSFAVQNPLALACFLVLAVWLWLMNRWVSRDLLPSAVARFGRLCGAGVVLGGVVAALGLLLPRQSPPQYIVLGLGGLAAVLAMLAIPIWFLLVGRAWSRIARATTTTAVNDDARP